MNLDTQDNPMSSEYRERLIAEVSSCVSEFQDATNAVDQAVADHLGINRTDLQCLGVVTLRGPMTAGALAEACALTSGSVTAVLDRMERAGYLRRTSDPADRRRVLCAVPRRGFRPRGAEHRHHFQRRRGNTGPGAPGRPGQRVSAPLAA